MPLCRKCGKKFDRNYMGFNQKYCTKCSFWIDSKAAYLRNLGRVMEKLKKEADRSGNPRIWTCEEYSQPFLLNLVEECRRK
jgi:hypothetical protein